ncbi:MAG: VWA domain-containing protein [Candidatus Sericytochromatia bacterium]|nr:VWA domain-containing protein [Candidatus Sericytochromatia bacterium]
MELTRGANVAIPATSGTTLDVVLHWQPPSGTEIDASAFLLLATGRVRTDDDMIFYNQARSACGAVSWQGKTGPHPATERFSVALAKVPADVAEIALTLTMPEGSTKTFQNVSETNVLVTDGANTIARYVLVDVGKEAAMILGKFYRHGGGWKFKAVGQGFNGGLAALATSFGITVEEPAPPVPTPTPAPQPAGPISAKTVDLNKKIAEQAPQLLSLVKKAEISLAKVNLSEHRAKVALCLDISGSMNALYKSGAVQRFAEKILALATRFDDDGAIDVFLFGVRAHAAGEMAFNNCKSFIPTLLSRFPLEGGTDYSQAMKLIRAHYMPDGQGNERSAPVAADLPVYVMFVTGGQTPDEKAAEAQVRWGAYEPIFWQFMGIGKSSKDVAKAGGGFFARAFASDFSFLEKLDALTGRYVDNANFFSIESPEAVSDDQLYDLLMAEYPDWVKAAPGKQLLR